MKRLLLCSIAKADEIERLRADLDILKRHYNLHPDAPLSREKTIAAKDAEIERLRAVVAAAPDLLAALHEIETIINESAGECRKRMGTRLGNIFVTARAAIAKAEGAS